MHHVSCSPSKIPYVGFSPVRLQTGIQPRSSLSETWVKREARIHHIPASLYMAKADVSGSCYSPLCGSIDHLTPAIQSRGPWLACGLCCPAGSSLTMASSETLAPSHRLIFFVRQVFALRPRMGWLRELPQFAPRVFSFVPPSVPRQTQRLPLTVSSPLALAFTQSAQARHLHPPRTPVLTWPCLRGCKVRSLFLLLRPEGLLALHRQGHLLSSFHLPSHLKEASNITTRAHSQFPRPDLHRLDTRPYGLRTESTEITEKDSDCRVARV